MSCRKLKLAMLQREGQRQHVGVRARIEVFGKTKASNATSNSVQSVQTSRSIVYLYLVPSTRIYEAVVFLPPSDPSDVHSTRTRTFTSSSKQLHHRFTADILHFVHTTMAFGRSNSLSLNTGAANSLLYVHPRHPLRNKLFSTCDDPPSHSFQAR